MDGCSPAADRAGPDKEETDCISAGSKYDDLLQRWMKAELAFRGIRSRLVRQ